MNSDKNPKASFYKIPYALKKIILILPSDASASDLDSWKNTLTEAGILLEIQKVLPSHNISFFSQSGILVLVNTKTDYAFCCSHKLPVIFYQSLLPELTDAFSDLQNASDYSIKYVIENVTETEIAYLNQIYCHHHHLPCFIAETERLILRETTLSDVPTFYQIYRDSEITSYMENLFEDPQVELEYTKNYIQNIYGFYGFGIWTVMLKETGEIIGRAGFEMQDTLDFPVMGFMIAKPHWKQGYAYEICSKIIELAHRDFFLEALYAKVHPENTASIRLCQKLGFEAQQKNSQEILFRIVF